MSERRILLVDDDPVYLTLGAEELASRGYDVTEACNGSEALSKFGSHEFDLVISDLEMPILSGLELLDKMRADPREEVSALPFIMITGRGDLGSVERAYDRGATSFVQKPVNWLTLVHHVGFVLRSSEQAAALRIARDNAKKALCSKEAVLLALRHELRSPLHVIQGFADLLSQKLDKNLDQESKLAFGYIDDGVDDMIDKIDKLFLYADIINGDDFLKTTEVSLNGVIEVAVSRVRKLSEASNTKIITCFDKDLEHVHLVADEKMLATAIGHVLDNAIKFSPPDSTVNIRIHDFQRNVEITIEDEGDGFDLAQTDLYLEGFGQRDGGLTRVSSGIGLGLTLANRLTCEHGGVLSLANSANGGGLVSLRLNSVIASSKCATILASADW